jgi:hypothetical protein
MRAINRPIGCWGMRMMNRWRFFELAMAAILLFAGAALVYYANVEQSATAGAVLIAGAAISALGVMLVVSAIRSILWHRRMIHHAMPQRSAHRSGHSHRGLLHRHR